MLEYSPSNRLTAVENVLSIFVPKHKKAILDPGISSYTLTVALSSKSTKLSTCLLYVKMLYLPSSCTRLCRLGLALVCCPSRKKSSSSPSWHTFLLISVTKEVRNLFWSLPDSPVDQNLLMHWLAAWFSFSVVTHLKFHQYSSARQSVSENQLQQPFWALTCFCHGVHAGSQEQERQKCTRAPLMTDKSPMSCQMEAFSLSVKDSKSVV